MKTQTQKPLQMKRAWWTSLVVHAYTNMQPEKMALEDKVKVAQSCPTLQPHRLYNPWDSPGQNTGVGSLSLLQEVFPTQGLNPGLPHCRQILYQLSHKGRIKRKQKNTGRISYRLQILCWLGEIKCLTKTVLWVWTAWHDWYYSVMVNHLNQWKASERNVVVKRNLDWFLHLFQPLNRWHRGIGCSEVLPMVIAMLRSCCWAWESQPLLASEHHPASPHLPTSPTPDTVCLAVVHTTVLPDSWAATGANTLLLSLIHLPLTDCV